VRMYARRRAATTNFRNNSLRPQHALKRDVATLGHG
jgi:hypothetical protein